MSTPDRDLQQSATKHLQPSLTLAMSFEARNIKMSPGSEIAQIREQHSNTTLAHSMCELACNSYDYRISQHSPNKEHMERFDNRRKGWQHKVNTDTQGITVTKSMGNDNRVFYSITDRGTGISEKIVQQRVGFIRAPESAKLIPGVSSQFGTGLMTPLLAGAQGGGKVDIMFIVSIPWKYHFDEDYRSMDESMHMIVTKVVDKKDGKLPVVSSVKLLVNNCIEMLKKSKSEEVKKKSQCIIRTEPVSYDDTESEEELMFYARVGYENIKREHDLLELRDNDTEEPNDAFPRIHGTSIIMVGTCSRAQEDEDSKEFLSMVSRIKECLRFPLMKQRVTLRTMYDSSKQTYRGNKDLATRPRVTSMEYNRVDFPGEKVGEVDVYIPTPSTQPKTKTVISYIKTSKDEWKSVTRLKRNQKADLHEEKAAPDQINDMISVKLSLFRGEGEKRLETSLGINGSELCFMRNDKLDQKYYDVTMDDVSMDGASSKQRLHAHIDLGHDEKAHTKFQLQSVKEKLLDLDIETKLACIAAIYFILGIALGEPHRHDQRQKGQPSSVYSSCRKKRAPFSKKDVDDAKNKSNKCGYCGFSYVHDDYDKDHIDGDCSNNHCDNLRLCHKSCHHYKTGQTRNRNVVDVKNMLPDIESECKRRRVEESYSTVTEAVAGDYTEDQVKRIVQHLTSNHMNDEFKESIMDYMKGSIGCVEPTDHRPQR